MNVFDSGLSAVVFGIPRTAGVSYLDLAKDWTHGRDVLNVSSKNAPHPWVHWKDTGSWSLGAQLWFDEISSVRIGTSKALFPLGVIDSTDLVAIVTPSSDLTWFFKSTVGHYLKGRTDDKQSLVKNFSLDLNRFVADGKNRDSIFGITGVTADGFGLTFSSKIEGLWETFKPNVRSISIRESDCFLTISDSFSITKLGDVEKKFDDVAKVLTGTFERIRGYLTIDNKSVAPAPAG